jgi:hypothetical protein
MQNRKIFSLVFFYVMIHLTLYLPREVELAGPVQIRWKYLFKRKLKKYKKWMHNKVRSNGSIAEYYLAEENLTFYSMYLQEIETR